MYIYTHSQFKTLEYCIYVYIMISKNSSLYNWKITEKVETFKMCCFFIMLFHSLVSKQLQYTYCPISREVKAIRQ